MFMSPEFKNGSMQDKKELIGNTIYKHVEKIVGENKAPKITGMLIDLPEVELNFSVSNWNNFYTKVQSAFALIQESENRAPGGAQASPDQQKVVSQ
jgi:L-fucose mutarotase/ribose pyranase (RbsD/FucU family)